VNFAGVSLGSVGFWAPSVEAAGTTEAPAHKKMDSDRSRIIEIMDGSPTPREEGLRVTREGTPRR